MKANTKHFFVMISFIALFCHIPNLVVIQKILKIDLFVKDIYFVRSSSIKLSFAESTLTRKSITHKIQLSQIQDEQLASSSSIESRVFVFNIHGLRNGFAIN